MVNQQMIELFLRLKEFKLNYITIYEGKYDILVLKFYREALETFYSKQKQFFILLCPFSHLRNSFRVNTFAWFVCYFYIDAFFL